jgi:HD-GYP domain-containing protein (c-di-GMP phosphodiesterase class II)
MSEAVRVDLWDLAAPLAHTFDMMSEQLADHSLRVGYLGLRLAQELGLPPAAQREVALAGVLHDIGAFSLGERLRILEFDEGEGLSAGDHARAGALLLRTFTPFAAIADVVEFHHYPWAEGAGRTAGGRPVPEASHLLHLADRTAVIVPHETTVLGRVPGICAAVAEGRGARFAPEHVDALQRLASRDYVWLDIATDAVEEGLRESLGTGALELDLEGLLGFARLICRIIDFRSEFTATHSSGVAAVGRELAALAGFSANECSRIEIAACLHDLGKLAIPVEILEKPGRLDAEEWSVMRTHVYFTHRVLGRIAPLGEMAVWGALHQERLDGSGYPFHRGAEDIPLGARVMAVADVFTGLTEDRPYRAGMPESEVARVMRELADRRGLDARLVDLLTSHYAAVDRRRIEAQDRARRDYQEYREALAHPAPPAA